MKEDTTDEACSLHAEDDKYTETFYSENFKG